MQNENSKFKIFKKFKKNILLKYHTTFKIGGPAKYFYQAKTQKDLIAALRVAKKMRLPFFVLGEGSNLLISDKGFKGLAVKLKINNYKLKTDYLHAASGVSMATLVKETGKSGLSGLEWAGGLPGTLGGAILGNAGAFGGETKDTVVWVEALDKNLRIRRFTKKQCQFKYRSSIFKKKGWIVLSAELLLKKGNKKNIKAVASSLIKQRKEKGPLEYPSAGSIFKNCDIRKVPKKTLEIFKDVVKEDPFSVIPTAAIIAKVPGLMGTKEGGAQVSAKHPNFIVNRGGAKAGDVIKLIKLIKQKVKKTFAVDIEEEIRYIE